MWFEFLALAFFTRRANVALAPFVMVPEVLVETFVEVMRFKFVEEAFAPRLTWIRFWKVDLCLLLPFSNWFRTEDEEGAIELRAPFAGAASTEKPRSVAPRVGIMTDLCFTMISLAILLGVRSSGS